MKCHSKYESIVDILNGISSKMIVTVLVFSGVTVAVCVLKWRLSLGNLKKVAIYLNSTFNV